MIILRIRHHMALSQIKTYTQHIFPDNLFKIGEDRIINNTNEITEILYVGWLEKEKGIKELIEAVKTLTLKVEVLESNQCKCK